jgi:2-polyprenyl-6-methoxyphenol hydroxylase-like FAD-dependent oxidoreductase
MDGVDRASPILVVGAGTTGLVMACELARHGVGVRVVDRLAASDPHVRATTIHVRTLEVFHDLGVADEIVAAGQQLVAMNVYVCGRRVRRDPFEVGGSPYPFPVSLGQSQTENVLERLLGRLGVAVERQTELVSLTEHEDGVTATLRSANGSEERFDTPWLVACDGAHSRVRRLVGLPFPGEDDARPWVVADIALEGLDVRDEIHAFMSDAGMLSLFPLCDGRVAIGAPTSHGRGVSSRAPALAELEALFAERAPGALRPADVRWLSHFHIHYRLSPHYRHDRVLLAGDAVHIHSPIGGQGMNTGIQDAYNLAWKLALVLRGRAPVALLDSYEQERRSIADDVIKATRLATDQFEEFGELSAAERDRLYAQPVVTEAGQRRIARHREEVDLDYSASPICVEDDLATGSAHGPAAGAQAPDASPLVLGDRRLTLFELLRGPRHTLLLFPQTGATAADWRRASELAARTAETRGDLIESHLVATAQEPVPSDLPAEVSVVLDPEGALRGRYAADGQWLYLIRPDGYIGHRCRAIDRDRFHHYLDRVGLGAAWALNTTFPLRSRRSRSVDQPDPEAPHDHQDLG